MASPCLSKGGFVNHVQLQTIAEKVGLFGESFKQAVGWTRSDGLRSDSGSEAEEGIFD